MVDIPVPVTLKASGVLVLLVLHSLVISVAIPLDLLALQLIEVILLAVHQVTGLVAFVQRTLGLASTTRYG